MAELSECVENTEENRRNCSLRAISPFFRSVFKRLVLQTCKNQGLFGKGLKQKNLENKTKERSKEWLVNKNPDELAKAFV